ncbi:MAG: hypothetical protein [Caudoviricetes sp.]|nr:MAG: hypothetical protein [Caudoviricetes sp.]
MSYTYSTAIGDGVTTTFPFSFAGQDNGYIATSNIHVYVAGTEVPFSILSNDPNRVYLTTAPPIGAEVLIRRIMPKDIPYSDFSRGNPFSQDTLNNTNLQQLYIVQEIFDGYLPIGFFFRTDIDMGGHKFINLGDGVNPGDSVNFGQLSVEHDTNVEQDSRLDILEDALATTTIVNYVSQLFVSTVGGETSINTTGGFHAGAVYHNGIFQHKAAGAYMQTGGVVTLAEPLVLGDEVYLILGSDLPEESLYPSIESFNTLQDLVDEINSAYARKGDNTDITSLSGLTTALSVTQGGTGGTTQATARAGVGAAASGANTDITSLGGLTTPLSVAQGGTGGATPAAARNGISAAVVGGNNDITSLETLTNGIKATTTGVAAAADRVASILTAVSPSPVGIGTGVNVNAVSLALPAGDWEIDCALQLTNSGSVTSRQFGLSLTSAVLPTNWYEKYSTTANLTGGVTSIDGVPLRINVAATTTVYLVINIAFVGTCTVLGYIRARRAR